MLCLMLTILSLSVVSAQLNITDFDSPDQHALYQRIIQELRCLVCQNQNLADSNADLAKDLRRKSSEMIKQHKGYDEIIQYMVERYGEFVLYRPRLTAATWLLWFSPFVILIALLGFVWLKIRRVQRAHTTTHCRFSKEELDNARSLINNESSS